MLEMSLLTAVLAAGMLLLRSRSRRIADVWRRAHGWERVLLVVAFAPIPGPLDELAGLVILRRIARRNAYARAERGRCVQDRSVLGGTADLIAYRAGGFAGVKRAASAVRAARPKAELYAGEAAGYSRVGALHRRLTDAPRWSSGWSVGRSSPGRPPRGPSGCPLAPEIWLWCWPRGRGSPPLRFASTRGPPSSTSTSKMSSVEARRKAVSGSERAAVRPAARKQHDLHPSNEAVGDAGFIEYDDADGNGEAAEIAGGDGATPCEASKRLRTAALRGR